MLFIVSQPWHDIVTVVTRTCHSRETIVALLWHVYYTKDIFLRRHGDRLSSNRIFDQRLLILPSPNRNPWHAYITERQCADACQEKSFLIFFAGAEKYRTISVDLQPFMMALHTFTSRGQAKDTRRYTKHGAQNMRGLEWLSCLNLIIRMI